MATFYAEALRIHTHLSPCMLAGYSLEGVIAFETARQFQAMGGKVEIVILLDSRTNIRPQHPMWSPGSNCKSTGGLCSKAKIGVNPSSIGSGLWSSWPIVWWMLKREVKGYGRRFQHAVLRDPGMLSDKTDEKGVHLRRGLIERLFLNAINSYRPQRLDCRGVLFRG